MNKLALVVLFVFVVAVFLKLLIPRLPVCDLTEGWGRGVVKECRCSGFKVTIENSLPRDGMLKTVCVGFAD